LGARAHVLLQKEGLLAAKAVDYALGRATAAELSALQQEVRGMRMLAGVLFEKALGPLTRKPNQQ